MSLERFFQQAEKASEEQQRKNNVKEKSRCHTCFSVICDQEHATAKVALTPTVEPTVWPRSHWSPEQKYRAGGKLPIDNQPSRSEQFGQEYGVWLREWHLLQRSVVVIDRTDRIVYVEYVSDQMSEPDYSAAIQAVQQAATE